MRMHRGRGLEDLAIVSHENLIRAYGAVCESEGRRDADAQELGAELLRRLSAGNSQQITHADRAEIGSVLPPESDIEERGQPHAENVQITQEDAIDEWWHEDHFGDACMGDNHSEQCVDSAFTAGWYAAVGWKAAQAEKCSYLEASSGEQRETRVQGESEPYAMLAQDIDEAQRSAARVEAKSPEPATAHEYEPCDGPQCDSMKLGEHCAICDGDPHEELR